MNPLPLVRAEGLTKSFPVAHSLFGRPTKFLHAVRGVSLSIPEGATLAVVGESGSGKSTLGRLLLHLLTPTTGRVFLGGDEITGAAPATLRRLRRSMQMIFQDPYAALDPRMTVGAAVQEALDIHEPELPRAERRARVSSLLSRVGLREDQADAPPSAFSGGQRQRVVIARALAVGPRFLVADEPVSALDVSIQAQIVNLLLDLQAESKLTYLFVSHDLEVVEHVTAAAPGSRVAVMYLGRIVEEAAPRALFASPRHPYTAALLSAIPGAGQGHGHAAKPRVLLEGDLPSPMSPPAGCAFHPRCPLAKRLDLAKRARCETEDPVLRQIGDSRAACHWSEEL